MLERNLLRTVWSVQGNSRGRLLWKAALLDADPHKLQPHSGCDQGQSPLANPAVAPGSIPNQMLSFQVITKDLEYRSASGFHL